MFVMTQVSKESSSKCAPWFADETQLPAEAMNGCRHVALYDPIPYESI